MASIMEQHGIEWEQKGTREKHLSVLDFEKRERAKEVEALTIKAEEKQVEYSTLSRQVENLERCGETVEQIAEKLDTDPKLQLPEPQGHISAKSYKAKFAEPLVEKLKDLMQSVLVKYFRMKDSYEALRLSNIQLQWENGQLRFENKALAKENRQLRGQTRDYRLLRKFLGGKQVDALLEQAMRGKQRSKVFQR